MSFSMMNLGGATPGRGAGPTPGRIQGGAGPMNYPSPFFDIAHSYLPTTVKQLFRFCRYYYFTQPLITATITKLAEYPITDLVIDHEDRDVRDRWLAFFHDQLTYRTHQIEAGLDFFTYGTNLNSIYYPFHKYLQCPTCKWKERADKIRPYWVFTNFNFRLNCPRCEETGNADVTDVYLKNASGIRLVRWNPEDLDVSYNDISGESTWFFNTPNGTKNDIVIGRKDKVETLPQVWIQALRQQRSVTMSKENLFVMKRPSIAWQDRGWGCPIIMPILKDAFLYQMMKKSQETIVMEHIIPLNILFPQAAGSTSDPFTTVALTTWKDHIAQEIARWRQDPQYYPIMPLPVGHQTVGGDARALLITDVLQQQGENLITGMGVPREFVFGGMSYSGTQVSMRMVENSFIGYQNNHKRMANWVMRQVASYMDWPMAKVRFKTFKMADDVQRKMYLMQLQQTGIGLSKTSLLADSDIDIEEEASIIERESAKALELQKKEQIGQAQIQGEVQTIMMKMQAKGQQALMEAQTAGAAPGEPGDAAGGGEMGVGAPAEIPGESPLKAGGEQGGVDLVTLAQGYAQQFSQMPPDQQQQAIQSLQAQSPELAQLVQQFMSQQQPQPKVLSNPQGATLQGQMAPLPEKLPPRRTLSPV